MMFDNHVWHPLPAWHGDESHMQNSMRHHVLPSLPLQSRGTERQPHRLLPATDLMSWEGREWLSRRDQKECSVELDLEGHHSYVAQSVKNLPANAGVTGDTGLNLVSGQSPGRRNGNPFQFSCLENPIDRRTLQFHGAAKESDTT